MAPAATAAAPAATAAAPAAPAKTENIQVVVRCRPINDRERAEGADAVIVDVNEADGSVRVAPPNGGEPVPFTFDAAFGPDSDQHAVYERTARGIVASVLEGFNGTVLAYGQTGTGKTFTMQGLAEPPSLRGIIPNTFNHLFDHIAQSSDKNFLVTVSFLEIYNEEIRDLLVHVKGKQTGLPLKEHPETGVYVKDLSSTVVKSVDEMERLMTLGNKNRSVGATLMNEQSSRSHSIFTVTVESSQQITPDEVKFIKGKLNLVDLAGSERQGKTGATGDRLKEATKINLSLSALGNCISALVDGKSAHIPYRDSKLTRLLQDSLGGNAKTLMIATFSPSGFNYDETVGTLRYANRAKKIRNKPKINEDPKDAMLRQFQEEIERLRAMIQRQQTGGVPDAAPAATRSGARHRPDGRHGHGHGHGAPSESGESAGDESAGYSGSDSEGGEDAADREGVSHATLAALDPATIAQLQREVEAEKRMLLASKDIVVEEKQRLSRELEQRAQELEAERVERERLANELRMLENKLLKGGDAPHLEAQLMAQQRELDARDTKLQAQMAREAALQRELEERQGLTLQIEENYNSLQEEVDVKSKKLKKLWSKLQNVKAEIADLQDEFRLEREDLLENVRELSKELHLKTLILDHFVPDEARRRVEQRAVYDDALNNWRMEPLAAETAAALLDRPTTQPHRRAPLCTFARTFGEGGSRLPTATGPPLQYPQQQRRYRADHLLVEQIELPPRTVFGGERVFCLMAPGSAFSGLPPDPENGGGVHEDIYDCHLALPPGSHPGHGGRPTLQSYYAS